MAGVNDVIYYQQYVAAFLAVIDDLSAYARDSRIVHRLIMKNQLSASDVGRYRKVQVYVGSKHMLAGTAVELLMRRFTEKFRQNYYSV